MSTGSKSPRITIGTKILIIAVCPVVLALSITVATLLVQQQRLDREVTETVRQQGLSESSKIANNVYLLCAGSEQRNQAPARPGGRRSSFDGHPPDDTGRRYHRGDGRPEPARG